MRALRYWVTTINVLGDDSKEIEFFFEPAVPLQRGPLFSVLHLARREMQDCLLGEVVPEDGLEALLTPAYCRHHSHRVVATCLVVWSGVDLLAKFYAGSDDRGGVSDRFLGFAERFFFPDHVEQFDFANNKRSHPTLWRRTDRPDSYMVSVVGLCLGFLRSIHGYEAALRSDPDLRPKFARMFESYATIQIQDLRSTTFNSDAKGRVQR